MSELPRDHIQLGNGEVWKVPQLPGGASEVARRCRAMYWKMSEASKRVDAAMQMIEMDAESGKDAPEETERRKGILNSEWVEDLSCCGFEMLRALYELDKEGPVSEKDARALFPFPLYLQQAVRAMRIVILGEAPIGDEEDAEPSDFSAPENESTEPATGG